MRIQNLNWEWAMDTLDMLRQSIEEATAAHDGANLRCQPIPGEAALRRSIRNSLKSVQRDLADSVVSIRGILSDRNRIEGLHAKPREGKPPAEDDFPF